VGWVYCGGAGGNRSSSREKLDGRDSSRVSGAYRVYKAEEARGFLAAAGLDPDTVGPQIVGQFISAFGRACCKAGVRLRLLRRLAVL